MYTRSNSDVPRDAAGVDHGPSPSGSLTPGRRITLTETCDFVPLEVSGDTVAQRRFGLLVFCDGEAQIRLFEEGATAVVGREPPCEIVVRDPSISRQHARFSMKDGEVWVEDLDSRNGTLLAGRRVQRARLQPSDEVHVGRARLVVVATRTAERARADAPEPMLDQHVVQSPAMSKLYETVARVSRSNLPVLILGETGVGKEHVATTLHRQGDRRDGPFVAINCGSIPSSLLEATFFGQDRALAGAGSNHAGAFERAAGGVLFLDEIGELASAAQAALLRAIETGRIARLGSAEEIAVDVRIVAATHCDLEAMVEDGTFRQDLYFRLNGLKLEVPPLRERVDEIDPLVDSFIEQTRTEWGTGARSVDVNAKAALRQFPWPGNVRQLRHAVERAALLCKGELISVSDLPEYVISDAPREQAPPSLAGLTDLALREQVSRFERALMDEALRRAAGNRRAAAKLLRIPVRTFFRKMRMSGGSEAADT